MNRTTRLLAVASAAALLTVACEGSTTTTTTTTAAAPTEVATPVDETALPLGDGLVSTEPEEGSVWSCMTSFNGGAAFRQGPWIDAAADTWNATEKISVRGSKSWPAELEITADDDTTELEGNGLPTTPTGTFPVASTDPAYQYDRNPNTITPYTLDVVLPASPAVARTSSCVGGTIGVSVLGAPIYSAFDAAGRDAVANEVQDACDGHPQMSGQYHFHSLSDCFEEAGEGTDDGLFGYALDGFGIYVERDDEGNLLSTADLDECHGRTSEVMWKGELVEMYHYVATADFPYLIGCFRGTPITSATGLQIGRAG